MIKECPVVMSNDLITVVKFGDSEIQLPYSSIKDKTVYVKCENGIYSIVDGFDKNYEEQPVDNHFYSVTTFEDKKKTINDEDYKQK